MNRILLTAGRFPITLELARLLHANGHTVFVADNTSWNICRFSNAVSKTFEVSSPRLNPEAYIEELINITKEENIDLLIPMWEDILYLSNASDHFTCKVLCSPFDTLKSLHNKWLFKLELTRLGIRAPETLLLEPGTNLSEHPLPPPYVLKPCYTRAAQHLTIVKEGNSPPKQLPTNQPWIAQKFIEGKSYCSYSICQSGKVRAHSAYPVQFSIDGYSCLVFKAINHPGIQQWVENFAEKMELTGQFAFDFIENEQGIFPIECNPRATSGIHLFRPEDQIDKAFLNTTDSTITPLEGRTKQIGTGMTIYGWRLAYQEGRLGQYFKSLLGTEDVILNRKDIKPFLAETFLLPMYLIEGLRKRENLAHSFTSDFNWDG